MHYTGRLFQRVQNVSFVSVFLDNDTNKNYKRQNMSEWEDDINKN